jgi:hypothetical protein
MITLQYIFRYKTMNFRALLKQAGIFALSTIALVAQVEYEGRKATILSNDKIELWTLDRGGAFAKLILKDDSKQVNPMWEPARMAREAGSPPRFGDSLGHFVCVDGFGGSSPEERRAGLEGHGEAHRLPWDKVSQLREGAKQTLSYRVKLPLVQEIFSRRMELVDGEQVVYVASELESLLSFDRPVNWAEHATIGAPFLAPGKTVVDASAGQCQTRPHQMQPPNRTLASGKDFTYPMAPRLDGGLRDVRLVPDPPNSMDHTACTIDPSRQFGFVTALNTEERLLLGYVFRREEYPWLQEWLNFPPNGQLSRGLEFATQPYDLPRRQTITQASMFGVPTYRWLPAKGKIQSRFILFWTRVPAGMKKVDDVQLVNGKLTIRGGGTAIELAASLGL